MVSEFATLRIASKSFATLRIASKSFATLRIASKPLRFTAEQALDRPVPFSHIGQLQTDILMAHSHANKLLGVERDGNGILAVPPDLSTLGPRMRCTVILAPLAAFPQAGEMWRGHGADQKTKRPFVS
jgi:hypothetical protein